METGTELQSPELKFRVWDKKVGCFFEPTYRAYAGQLRDLSIGLNGMVLLRTMDHAVDMRDWQDGRWVVSRFTGFRDAKGGEIFEGDILCYEKKINLPGKPGAHKIENHYWEVFMSPKGQWCMHRGEVAHALFGSNEKHTVAGNIFETPDLLK